MAVFVGPPRAVILEGWCLGATKQDASALMEPMNALERDEDPDGRWRQGVNDALAWPYTRVFGHFDALLFLKAPGFDRVLDWRVEQEAGLIGTEVSPARRAELARFIQVFERLTRHMLAGGIKADLIAELDADRHVRHIGARSGT